MNDEGTKTPQRFGFRPGWFILGVFSLAFAGMLWLVGIFSGGLDTMEVCNLRHGQHYDRQYRKAHPEHANRSFFPLSDKCNADYQLVPIWINPAIASLALFGVGTTVVLPIRDVTSFIKRRAR